MFTILGDLFEAFLGALCGQEWKQSKPSSIRSDSKVETGQFLKSLTKTRLQNCYRFTV